MRGKAIVVTKWSKFRIQLRNIENALLFVNIYQDVNFTYTFVS